MSLETALVYHLKNDAGVAAAAGARIFPSLAPEDTDYPYIVFNRISTARRGHQDAASGLADALMQISVWDDDPLTAATTADAVRDALDGYQWSTMGGGGETCAVHRVSLQGQRDAYAEPPEGKEDGIYGVQLDFNVIYEESVPTFS